MNEARTPQEPAPADSSNDRITVSFHGLIAQELNMALMFLGKVPHPETGQQKCDLDAAQVFIDQLEMLEVKTKGNLDKTETALLKQALTLLRMAFVEAVDQGQAAPPASGASAPPTTTQAAADVDAESRKKFSKKYD